MVNGKREGKGTYYFEDGDIYEGEWKDGKKKEKVFIIIKMEIYMKAIGKIVTLMEKEFITIKVEMYMMENI